MALPNLFALIGSLIWLGYELVLRSRNKATRTWQACSGDRGSTYLMIGAYFVAAVVGSLWHAAAPGHVHQSWRWFGVILLAAGLGLRAWSMRTLGSAFTRTLRTLADQAVVDAGPYHLVRHPGYAGSLLVWLGYELGNGNWLIMSLVGALLLTAYVWRMSAEERLLGQAFGATCAAYQARTKRLVPFVY